MALMGSVYNPSTILIHAHTHAHTRTHAHAHTHTRTHPHTHTHTHAHTHTHTHTHTHHLLRVYSDLQLSPDVVVVEVEQLFDEAEE